MTDTTLPCVVCHKTLLPATGEPTEGQIRNQPVYGTAFTSHGHYGSSFDPMSGGIFLELNICDDCLKTAAKAGHVYLGRTPHTPRPPVTYETYDPEEYYGD